MAESVMVDKGWVDGLQMPSSYVCMPVDECTTETGA